ncbi:MAG: hypothetical protein ACYCOR_10800 [Acidobacteriaceae bacterium]
MATNIKVIQGGAVPLPTDVNQLGEALMGNADLGALSLFGTIATPAAPTVAVNTTAGNLTGTYDYQVVIATGWKSSNGNIHISGFAPGTASAAVVCVGEMVNLTEIPTGAADSTNQYGSVARLLYRYGVVTPPTTGLSLSLVADSSSTLAATTYYVAASFGNANGDTPVGSSEASIVIATADTEDIRFNLTPPSGATYAIVGLGTATGAETQYAKISTAGAVTFVGTNSSGVTATVSSGVLTITITAPQTDTSTAMPTTNTAYLVGSGYEFVAAIGDNTTTTWTDNLKDSSVGTGMPTSSSSPTWDGAAVTAAVPTVNTTGTTLSLAGGAIHLGDELGSRFWVDANGNLTTLGITNLNGQVTLASPLAAPVNPNLLPNPTFAQGEAYWGDTSTSWGAANTWGSDFSVSFDGYAGGSEAYSAISPGTGDAAVGLLFRDNTFDIGVILTLSGDVNAAGVTAGTGPTLEILCFSGSQGTGSVLLNNRSAAILPGTHWARTSVTATIPTGTVSVAVRFVNTANTTSTFMAWRKLKLEAGSVATVFTDDQGSNPATLLGHPAVVGVVADPPEVELTTTSATQIFTYTPSVTGRFTLNMLARVTTATTTVTATLTYTSASGAQTYTVWNAQSLAVTDNSAFPFYFQAVAGYAITLTVTAGTANQVYIDATLEAK